MNTKKQEGRPKLKHTPSEMAEAELRFLLLKENFDYIAAFDALGVRVDAKKHMGRFGDFLKLWGIQIASDGGTTPLTKYSDVVAFYDPRKPLDKNHPLYSVLPAIMEPCPVKMLVTRKTIGQSLDCRDSFGYPDEDSFFSQPLLPYERILKIDVRQPKEKILSEVELILDRIRFNKTSKTFPVKEPSYNGWDFKNARFRKEATDQLAIWYARKKRLSFKEIAAEHHITEDLAKKRFYRAYELTQGKPYDLVRFTKTTKVVRKADLSKDCNNCPDRKTCNSLCPDVLRYVEQDYVSRKENLPDKPFY